jgi:hypothetical protein
MAKPVVTLAYSLTAPVAPSAAPGSATHAAAAHSTPRQQSFLIPDSSPQTSSTTHAAPTYHPARAGTTTIERSGSRSPAPAGKPRTTPSAGSDRGPWRYRFYGDLAIIRSRERSRIRFDIAAMNDAARDTGQPELGPPVSAENAAAILSAGAD